MHNVYDFLESIKNVAVNATDASNPVQVLYGEVVSQSPLKIIVEQRLLLDEEMLIPTRAVKDHEVEMTVDHMTEQESGGSGQAAFAEHAHAYKGRKKFIIHNDLVVGDKVKLLRVQGGQQYIIFDKE